MFAGNNVIAILSLGGNSGNYWLWILKGRPRLYNHIQLTLFLYLERFRRYSISLLGAKFWGFLGKMTPKRQMREKHLLGGHFLTPNCVFWAIVRKIISIHLACAGAQEKNKAVKQEEKSQEVYISRMCGATLSGQILTKLGTCVRLTDVIKRAQFHHYNLGGFEVVRCWSFHVAIGNQGRP